MREHVVVAERLAGDRDLACLLVDLHLAGTGDAAASPTAGDDRRVAGHAAGAGENAGGAVHAVDVFRIRFLADQQDLLAGVASRSTASSAVKASLPTAAPGEAGRPLVSLCGFGLGLRDRSSAAAAASGRRPECAARPSFSSISFSLTMSQAIFTAAAPVRLPLRVCSMNSVPRSIVNSMSCMSR